VFLRRFNRSASTIYHYLMCWLLSLCRGLQPSHCLNTYQGKAYPRIRNHKFWHCLFSFPTRAIEVEIRPQSSTLPTPCHSIKFRFLRIGAHVTPSAPCSRQCTTFPRSSSLSWRIQNCLWSLAS
jgi:hypothetical protein